MLIILVKLSLLVIIMTEKNVNIIIELLNIKICIGISWSVNNI